MVIAIVFQALLWIWFLGCVFSWRFGKVLLVEGVGFKSMEFIELGIYTAGIAAFHLFPPAGKWILLGILALWFIGQFRFHWYYTNFGASERKLTGYNECFKGTVRLFPVSETRLVPDFYHIMLHLLILVNIVLCLV